MPAYQMTSVRFTKLPHYIDTPANLTYATSGSACFDVCAAIAGPFVLEPGQHAGIPTGIKLAPEFPLWFRVCSRSGLAIKHGIITIAGIIDTDYRGELIIGILNTTPDKTYTIQPGDKIAQVELPFPYRAEFIEVSNQEFELETTERGTGGFGSTGR